MSTSRDPDRTTKTSDPKLEAAEARRIILARRAQYMALAIASVGAATASCGGDMDDDNALNPCLSVYTGSGGNSTAVGGMHVCLQAPTGGAYFDSTGPSLGGAVGGMRVCLSIMPTGGMVGSGGNPANSGGATARGGNGGASSYSGGRGGMGPCLAGAPSYSGGRGGMGPCLSGAPSYQGGSSGMAPCLQVPNGGAAGLAGHAGAADNIDSAGSAGNAGATGVAGAEPSVIDPLYSDQLRGP